MKSILKSSIKLGIFIVALFMVSNYAFASTYEKSKSVVEKNQNNIQIRKSAKWYKDKIGIVNSEEKNLAQIDIKLDLSDMDVLNTKGQSTDLVFVLDTSISMDEGDKLDNLKKAGNKLFEDFLKTNCDSRRVGIVTFATDYKEVLPLTSDLSNVTSTIQNTTLVRDKDVCQTNLQGGIYAAQQVLKKSAADNKIMVILTDGNANREIMEKGPDVASGENPVFAAVNQAQIAKNNISNLHVVTIGLDMQEWGNDRLKEIATSDINNEKLNYAVNTGDVDLEEYLVGIFAGINYMAEQMTYEHMLVDYIPYGLEVYNNQIWCDDKDVDIACDEDKIIWNIGKEKLKNKIYNMGFIVTVDFKVLSQEYINKYNCFNTNGMSMEICKNSSDSLVFTYIKNNEKNEIGLISPQLEYLMEKQDVEKKSVSTKDDENKEKVEVKKELVEKKVESKELEIAPIEIVEKQQSNREVIIINKDTKEKEPKVDSIVSKKDIFVNNKLDKTPKTGYTDREMSDLEGEYKFGDKSNSEKDCKKSSWELMFIFIYVMISLVGIYCINKNIAK